MTTYPITLIINGEEVHESVEARRTLVDFLREEQGLTGSHVGCEHGVCGACTVRLDGAVVRASTASRTSSPLTVSVIAWALMAASR